MCASSGPEKKQVGPLLRCALCHFRLGGVCMFLYFTHHTGALRESNHIEDERHFSVTHDAGACECLDALKLLAQRLYYDFFRVVDCVHHEPKLAPISLQNHDVDGVVLILQPIRTAYTELAPKVNDRQEPTAQAVNRRAMHELDTSGSFRIFEPHELEQTYLRDCVAIAPRK